jgi:hypothetical protein
MSKNGVKTGKRALPTGSRATTIHISLPAYHAKLITRAMQRCPLGKSKFFTTLIDQAVGARLPLMADLPTPADQN